ncbi:hypothetical protein SAMN05444266_10487 [Chitinophaga jiangningensis]|uniref:Uncharacterized protein n=1 Tax=Chitinophaga jiangningensis TaxID=1419482 RepID=A0A1M7BVD2_9BACT|nr:hypothetical protein [Chitinophaga jiangningensis]SHL58887.1 hypothetical protein SAMN05444266_10487 [Chitinophaga jiangningensis]
MKDMTLHFLPSLNDFNLLFEQIRQTHLQHLERCNKWHKEILQECKTLMAQMQAGIDATPESSKYYQAMLENLSHTMEFYDAINGFREAFHMFVEETNEQLACFSTHWNGHLERLAIAYVANYLKKVYEVHTSYYKFKRTWGTGTNAFVEADMIAINSTHLFIAEAKKELKAENFYKTLYNRDRIRERMPEYAHLHFQPLFICETVDPNVARKANDSGLWILRYRGFDANNPVNTFEWLGTQGPAKL